MIAEIYRGGCVDSTAQGLSFLYMVLGQKDVSKIVTGPLSVSSIYFLRHIKDFFQTTFKIDNEQIGKGAAEDEEELLLGDENKVNLTCVGVGYANINKALL